MKCLILVNSLFQLIEAMHIRRQMFTNEIFDVVLSDECNGLQEIYQSKKLENIFHKVYFARTKAISKKLKFEGLFKPGIVVSKLIGAKLESYTDLFFWNPDCVFYYYYMEQNRKHEKMKLHVYSDVITGYLMRSPDCDKPKGYRQYPGKFLNNWMKFFYGFKRVDEMDFDYYMFNPEYSIIEHNHDIKKIPEINLSDQSFIRALNNVFEFDSDLKIKQKFVFLASVPGETSNPEEYKQIMESISEIVGKENFIVKPHPRTPKDEYKEMNVNILSDVFPWDLYCLNNNVDDMVFICEGSSSALMPSIMYGAKTKVVFFSFIHSIYGMKMEDLIELFSAVNKEKHNICFADDKEKLKNICKELV